MEKKMWLNLHWSKYDKSFQYRLSDYSSDPGDDYVTVREVSVPYDELPEQEARQKLFEQLMEKKKRVLADAYAESVEIEGMANELLALEYKPEEDKDDFPF